MGEDKKNWFVRHKIITGLLVFIAFIVIATMFSGSNEPTKIEEINKEIVKGTPFRDAYKNVGKKIQEGKFKPEKKLKHTHEGSIGNLCNEEIRKRMEKVMKKVL